MLYDTFDTTITVFTSYYSHEEDIDKCIRTIIENVSFYSSQKIAVSSNGYESANTFSVRIQSDDIPDGYLSPEEFALIEDIEKEWTIKTGDIVVKGKVDVDITKPADAKKLGKLHFTVTGTHDNRRGIESMQHIRIEGK